MANIKEFFDPRTWTLTYVVWDPSTRDAVVIDPVLDYDQAASKVWEESANEVIEYIRGNELKLHYILETHAHADHLSGSQVLKRIFPQAKVAIGERIKEVQSVFKGVFNLPDQFPTDGSQFDELFKDGQKFKAGSLTIEVLFTPGHTPACSSYIIGNAVFTGDALFMPDYGTGRCDFPAGSAETLYASVHDRLYSLPDTMKVYVGHDYLPNGRALEFSSTIGEEKKKNVHLRADTSREEFVNFRKARDKTLAAPKLLLPSVQINIAAGHLPNPEDNGQRYIKIPIR